MQLDTILLKVTSRCNINCSYCYVYSLQQAMEEFDEEMSKGRAEKTTKGSEHK
jgi:MoaA/NifB/PqqE/SkfB family radical SAM enzyme